MKNNLLVEWILFIIFFGVFGPALVTYFWLEIAKVDDDSDQEKELLF